MNSKRLIAVFHYALKADGCLMLGSAETTGAPAPFAILDKKWRIYRKAPIDVRLPITLGAGVGRELRAGARPNGAVHVRPEGGAAAAVRGSKLSDRETEVLRRIAQGYSHKEIAASLGLSVKTVETYKMRAMDKLGFQHRADLIRHAAKAGWLTEH